ncbi:MAG: nucleotidyltransferase domain-containing protein [Candidatus Pacearchaeota archaeon]
MKKMVASELKQIKEELKEIIKIKGVDLIYVYGSFSRYLKGTTKEYNDIDVLVILDERILNNIQAKLIDEALREVANKSKLKLHFQPCKFLGPWWRAVISGEPWILTSIRDSIKIHDPMNILFSIKSLIKQEKTYNKEERIETLINSSENFENKNREILLDSLNLLSTIATDICQLYLFTKKKIVLNKEKIYEEISKVKGLRRYSKIYKEILDLESKKDRGFLSEFTAENLDYYLEEINELIKVIEKEILKEEIDIKKFEEMPLEVKKQV